MITDIFSGDNLGNSGWDSFQSHHISHTQIIYIYIYIYIYILEAYNNQGRPNVHSPEFYHNSSIYRDISDKGMVMVITGAETVKIRK